MEVGETGDRSGGGSCVGCWVLGVGCWVSCVGCWVLGVGCWALLLNKLDNKAARTGGGGLLHGGQTTHLGAVVQGEEQQGYTTDQD